MADSSAVDLPIGQFVHLHNHSHYSLLDGLQKVPGMLDRAAELKMGAMAITDHGTLCGAIEFYTEAQKRGITPIIGMEAYVSPRKHTEKTGKIDANPYHLILLAYNNTGWQNLMKLTTISHLEGFYYKPRIDRDLLEQYHEGLIALSGCMGGEISQNLMNGLSDQAEEVVNWYKTTFGEGNYFIELQDHGHLWEEQRLLNDKLVELAGKTKTPMVVTADCHYSRHGDREAHEILLCVQTGKTMGDADRMTMDSDLFVSDPKDVAERWKHLPEVLENTVKIAERVDITIELGKILIPKFPVPTEQTEREYLHELAYQGLAWRYGGIAKEDIATITKDKAIALVEPKLVERLDFELGVIERMGYDGYFLIVADFINWGKNQDIIFGPGRGSAAGSIVAYVLNITDLDPMKYDLLFERFLNPDRISMPDIDVDMQDTRRGEVIDYVTEKYGQERVAQIITFGTMAARNAVRDTGRALGYTYAEVDVIAKLIPPPVQGRHIPLAVSIKKDPDLKKEYDGNPRAKQLIDLAMRLEGTIRSNGVHAAGVVIAPEAIVNYTPIQRAQKGGNATQFDMHWVEELGLLKMDFLGLSNLTVIQNALRIIKRVYGKTIDISQIPLDDVKTYELLSRGDTTGVFQLESAGMKRYLRELKPSVFDDIVAMVALYRPGPMQFIEDFIERKHGRKEVTFEHPGMEAALGTTYGILVYQEQFMQISKDMCGFTGGQADTLRKAIGKKQRDTMAKMKVAFIDGMVEHSGVSRAFADKFWGQLEAFADYCFNKSHSACYGLIAYQTAYLKAHFPAAFMAALMTSDYGNIERIAIEVAECQRMGIEVLPPDVNESFSEFAVILDKNAIRFGLAAIKNVGTGAIDRIVETRGDEPFASVEDFAKRVNAGDVNKKVWESLIKAGAMDGFDQRHILIHNVDLITGYASRAQKNALSGQIDIFGSLGSTENLPALRLDIPATSPDPREFLAWEKELLGLYLSNHPLREFEDFLAAHVSPLSELANMRDGNMITTGGIITTVRRIITKNGGNMAFVGFEDIAGSTELIVFPKSFEETADMWEPDRIVIIKGKVNSKDREGRDVVERKIMVDAVRLLTPELVAQYAGKAPSRRPTPGPMTAPLAHADGDPVIIAVPSMATQEQLMQLKSIFESHKGSQPVILQLEGIQIQRLKLPFNVTYTPDFAAAVSEVLANARVEAAA